MNPARRELAVLLLFCALTAVMTWPLLPNFTTALPNFGDPMIVTWILDWDLYAITHHPLQLFDANIFYPYRDTLAFSENLLGIALPLLPLYLAGVTPIALYNVAQFLAFALSAYGAYVLARMVTRSTGAAICAGIWFAFFSVRFTHLPHLQILWAMWLPLLLAALLHFARKPSWQRAALLGGAFLMNGLSNLHWFAFGSVAIAIAVLIVARRERNYWTGAAAAIAIACLALIPILLPYQRVRELHGFRADRAETLQYSAQAGDWLAAGPSARWYASQFDPSIDPERWLFPGALVLLFAIAGLFWRERITIVAAVWLVLGFLGSLGLNGFFGRLLFDWVPLFKRIRAPARWSFIAYTALALLAACGIALLTRRMRPRMRFAVQLLIACAFLAESWVAPIRWYLAIPPGPMQVEGPLVELPLTPRGNYEAMLRATRHHQPMVNGISGFTPQLHASLMAMSEQEQLLELQRLGVRTIIMRDAGSEEFRGKLEWPQWDSVIDGPFRLQGWAHAPDGIRGVELRFANGRIVIPADLGPRPGGGTNFFKQLEPIGIRPDTDVQVELIDGRGRRKRLPDVWFRWSR